MSIFSGVNNPGLGFLQLTSAEIDIITSITGLGDPGADRILFWDESANSYAFLTVGSGLSITDTTIAATGSGTGDVVGPASATDNAIARFDTTTGKLIQNSVVLIADTTGVISGTQGVTFSGTTSGTTALIATAIAGTTTLTLPAATDTLVGKATTDTLTNKTFNTAGTGNVFQINGTGITAVTGSGAVVLATSATLVTPALGAATATTIAIGGASIGADALAVTGSVSIVDGDVAIGLTNNADSASVRVADFAGNRTTEANNDEAYINFALKDAGDVSEVVARITWVITDVTAGSVDGRLDFSVMAADTLAKRMQLTPTDLNPSTNDALALGTTDLMWSDLFLASGAVINFNNGDVTLTHSADTLTMAGGNLSIGTTASFTAGTIELGAASDTTLARVSAGVVSIEGVNIVTTSSTDTLSNKTLTAPKFVDAGFIADANGNESLVFQTTASAVNEFEMTNAATGNAPILAVTGGDTNIDLKLTPKGTGKVVPTASVNHGAFTAYFTETDNGNSSTADTIDWTLSNKQKSTLTGNCTFTFTAPPGPCSLILKLVQDGTGSRTVTWPAAVHWSGGTAPTLTTTASKVDIISFYYDGSTYFGTSSLNYTA